MDKHTIIKLKNEGCSNREIARLTGMNRKTVARYWNEHKRLKMELKSDIDTRAVQEAITAPPKYDASGRKPSKYTEELDELLDEILAGEGEKTAALGKGHKQKLTNAQIHQLAREAGHDVGLTMVTVHVKEKRNRTKEAFIRQEYEYGERLEYDFGEVKLIIDGKRQALYMAVISSPRAGFRWAYLYRSQKKEVFLDSHVRFFEMAGGAYGEIVYDNMRNVVTRFIGKNEKQLNEDLIKMSIYYGFKINVTNCFRGNEKGHVEGSVKTIRNKVFALNYRFESIEEAEAHLAAKLAEINEKSTFAEEQEHLLSYMPPLELAQIAEQQVDKYSFVRVENNFYSVPEYLVGRKVLIKNYLREIDVYSAGNKVCSHQKKEGFHQMSVDVFHYLDTFMRKPGALKNSAALKSRADLKAIYDRYYTSKTREFIELLQENKDRNMKDLAAALTRESSTGVTLIARPAQSSIEDHVTAMAKAQLSELNKLFMGEESSNVN